MGDVNNGTHTVNLSIPNVAVGPNDTVAFSYSIVNTGFDENSVEHVLQSATNAAGGGGGGPPKCQPNGEGCLRPK
jgi:hypothetical protein